jgi:hypothetical protein
VSPKPGETLGHFCPTFFGERCDGVSGAMGSLLCWCVMNVRGDQQVKERVAHVRMRMCCFNTGETQADRDGPDPNGGEPDLGEMAQIRS